MIEATQLEFDWGRIKSRCVVCGRELKNIVSVKKGMGPVCRRKYGSKKFPGKAKLI